MQVTYATTRLAREFLDDRSLVRGRGKVQAAKIKLRVSTLLAAESLAMLRPPTPGHFHALHEDKAGWIAWDLDGPHRLIFEPDHEPLPMLPAGGLDWTQVTRVRILGVLNYHERNQSKPA